MSTVIAVYHSMDLYLAAASGDSCTGCTKLNSFNVARGLVFRSEWRGKGDKASNPGLGGYFSPPRRSQNVDFRGNDNVLSVRAERPLRSDYLFALSGIRLSTRNHIMRISARGSTMLC